jgi:hypothetical protein
MVNVPTQILFLVGNTVCDLAGRIYWEVAPNARLLTLSAVQIRAILNAFPDLAGQVTSDTKCIIFDDKFVSFEEHRIKSIAETLSFSANNLAEKHGLLLSRALRLKQGKNKETAKCDISGFGYSSDWKHIPFKFKKDAEPNQLAAVYGLCKQAISHDPSILVSISRMNSALLKQKLDERIIDICICLATSIRLNSDLHLTECLNKPPYTSIWPSGL